MHPDEISALLALQSTEAKPRDLNSPYPSRRDWNYWGWVTRGRCDSTENIDHVKTIIDALGGKRERLDRLRALGCEADLFSYWVGNGQGGPSLDVPTMQSLCELGLEIAWDIYFRDENEK